MRRMRSIVRSRRGFNRFPKDHARSNNLVREAIERSRIAG
jgi:hypothetical protein